MITPFFVLFGLMAVGYLSRKLGWLDDDKNQGLGNILVHIALPSLLLSSMIEMEIQGEVLLDFLIVTLLSAAFFFLYAALALFYMKLTGAPKYLRGMIQLSMLTSNNGFMGFPITLAFFGQSGLMLMVGNNLAMGMTIFSFGIYALKGSRRIYDGCKECEKTTLKDFLKQFFNGTIVAIFVGLFIGVMGLNSFIPEAVCKLLAIMGGLATPLSMIYIGVSLYGSSILSLFRNHLVLGVSLTRIVVFTSITFGIVYFLPISSLMKQILLLVNALPSAAIVPPLAAKYGVGADDAAKIVALSTVLSLLITPLGVFVALNFL